MTLTKSIYHIAVLLLFITCGEKSERRIISALQVAKEQLVLKSIEGKWYYKGEPFNGYAVVNHANGTLAESVGYYNGKKEGLAQRWYADGLLSKQSYYKANRLDGLVRNWSPNPKAVLIVESNYQDGARHGVQKRWYPNGQLLRKTHFNSGKEEGLQQAWLENGKIYINYEARNGRTFGLRKAKLCYELDKEIIQFGNQ